MDRFEDWSLTEDWWVPLSFLYIPRPRLRCSLTSKLKISTMGRSPVLSQPAVYITCSYIFALIHGETIPCHPCLACAKQIGTVLTFTVRIFKYICSGGSREGKWRTCPPPPANIEEINSLVGYIYFFFIYIHAYINICTFLIINAFFKFWSQNSSKCTIWHPRFQICLFMCM